MPMTHLANIRLFSIILAMALALGLGIPLTAGAATVSVCELGCDHTSIQAAVNAAFPGDVVELAPETFDEGDITIDKHLAIQTSSGRATIDADAERWAFNVKSGNTVIFADLVLRGGTVCRLKNEGVTTLSSVYVLGTGPGNPSAHGGILNRPSGFLTIRDSSVLAGNASTNRGGAVTNYGDLIIRSSTVTANTGRRGGGVFNRLGIVSIDDSSFSFNRAYLKGGAWANVNSTGGAVAFHRSSLTSGNRADLDCDKHFDATTGFCVD